MKGRPAKAVFGGLMCTFGALGILAGWWLAGGQAAEDMTGVFVLAAIGAFLFMLVGCICILQLDVWRQGWRQRRARARRRAAKDAQRERGAAHKAERRRRKAERRRQGGGGGK